MRSPDAQNPEPIWDLPGLAKDQFYAAAYFLSRLQSQQGPDEYTPAKCHTPAARRILLDGLALLFARAKAPGADRAANVTAVAMEEVKSGAGNRTIIFHVAKNGGPQTLDQQGDKAFADELAAWLNSDTDIDRDPRPLSGMWSGLTRFWNQRVRTYLKTIEQSEALVKAESELSEQFQSSGGPDLAAFKLDFKILLQYHLAARDEDLSYEDRIFKMCFHLPEVSDYKYPKYPAARKFERDLRSAAERRAEKFRKAIKHVRLLRTLRRLWEELVRIRDDRGGADIRIMFLRQHKPFPLRMEPVLAIMEGWKAFLVGKEKFATSVSTVTEFFTGPGQGPVRNRYFHCELQLLELCITAQRPQDFQDYFGCSKLSCALCWRVMKDADYQTKGTHARLYPDCAFPFSVSSADGHCRLAASLKRAQDQLLERILVYSMDIDNTFTRYVAPTETNPDAATIRPANDVDQRVLDWVKPEQYRPEDGTRQVSVLKLSCDGSSGVEERNFYDARITDPNGTGKNLQHQISSGGYNPWRATWHPIGRHEHAERWIMDLQTGQYLTRSIASRAAYATRPQTKWQWMDFTVRLNPDEHLYAEIQVMCRLEDDDWNSLPPNACCERMLGFSLEKAARCPWRGDLYIIGQEVVDDGTYRWPSELRSLNAENSSDFLRVFEQIVSRLAWDDVKHPGKLISDMRSDDRVERRRFDAARATSMPSREKLMEVWSAGIFDAIGYYTSRIPFQPITPVIGFPVVA
ncbi:uncharacterized protein DNG_09773 [Cephalotrichum gorgonifer]|uniref:Uncharacterized protein n=1 Tax=Cephalotrichum gorgonifer TaxID=2041049 RepID=A0AAE8SZL7_9PEZI|nr:uncharacterized protein DNG_09773 [Cephalotrichum gorgonifer]